MRKLKDNKSSLANKNLLSLYLTMSILTSTDLKLLTYIHVWNIGKNLSFKIIAFSLI